MNATAERLSMIHTVLNTLTSSPYSHDVLELALATATSLSLGGKEHPAPIWLLIAGAPSSGKTEAVLLLKEAPSVMYLDALTDNCFVSGYVDQQTGKGAQDLLPRLNGKCLIVKDLTTIFSMREDRVKKILGDFQSIYDGEYAKATGTRGLIAYTSLFSMVACVTPLALRKHHNYMSMIGGRFLVVQVLPLSEGEREAGFERAWDEKVRNDNMPMLRKLMLQHVNEVLQNPVPLEPETAAQRQQLNALAMLLSRGRGVVLTERRTSLDENTGHERHDYEIADVQIEEPYRALVQLRTLGRALARIHGRGCITDHEIELLRRVVLSTVLPHRSEALAVFRAEPSGVTVKDMVTHLDCSETWARQLLKESVALSLVSEVKERGGMVYVPKSDIALFIKQTVQVLDHITDLVGEVVPH
jgi:hypothetical protein